ncbi:MAG: hypothetical protein JXB48_07210, partial [Candidatus Latescibacteria bacterium]|nr:hypothetical protein [Candidatus Latescibacterota bacterium]
QHVVMFLRLYLITFLKSRWRSHEFGEKPPPLVVDSQIQVIFLLNIKKNISHILSCSEFIINDGFCFLIAEEFHEKT